MNTNSGALNFDAYISDTDFNRTIASMNRNIMSLTTTAKKETDKTADLFKGLGQAAAGAFAAFGLAQLPMQLIKVRGEFQQLETSFKVMLGSKAKADKLMTDVVKFAATTPFDLQGVAGATKQLLAYGFASEEVVGTLRRLGDISSGLNIPLNEMTEIYGKAKVGGRLYAEDFNKFIDRGIPLIQLLAKQFKVADNEVKQLVESGKVGFADVEKAVITLTGAGGMFAGLTAENAKSLTGLYSNLEDSISQMFNKIGKEQEGLLSGSILFATDVVENYEKILDVLTVLIAAYGTYRAALIAASAWQVVASVAQQATTYIQLGKAIGFAATHQFAFNGAVAANPYVLAGVALVSILTALYIFNDEVTEAEKRQNALNEALSKGEEAAAGETSKILVLTTQINDETQSREFRNKKLKELIALSPQHLNALTLETVATQEGKNAIDAYVDSMRKKIELDAIDAQLKQSILRQNAADKNQNELSFADKLSLSAAAAFGDVDYGAAKAKEQIRLNKEQSKAEKDLQKTLTDRVKVITGVHDATKKGAEDTGKALVKTVADFDTAISDLQSKLKKTTTRKEADAINREISRLQKQRAAITGEKLPGAAKTTKSERDATDDRVETFAEELDRKKKLYELYERWVLNYGKEAANAQFGVLVASNKTYLDYVNAQIAHFENMRDYGYAGKLTDTDLFDLDKLIGERTQLMGGKAPMEVFRDQLETARESASTLTEELQNLANIRAGLGSATGNPMQSDQLAEVTKREVEVRKEQKKILQEFLLNVAGSEEKRLEIVQHYGQLRAAAEARFGKDKGVAYKKVLDNINKAEGEELEKFSAEALKASKGFKELERASLMIKQNDTAGQLRLAREELALTTAGTNEYYIALRKVQDAEKAHKDQALEGWAALAGVVGTLGESLSGYGGSLGAIGGVISGVASAASNVSNTMKNMDNYSTDGKMNMQGYAAALQNVLNLIIGIIEASKKRKEAEKQFAAERLGLANDYQLAQNQQLGSDYKNNPFYVDYEGKVKAGVKQYEDAFKKYQEAIDKLNEGQAKERQKNVVDGKTTLSMVGSGAAAGAIIGTAVGGWAAGIGTVVGTAVGAVVGLIGGLIAKKKKDVFGALLDQYPELVTTTAQGWAEVNVELAKALITNNQVDAKTKEMLESALAYNEEMEKAAEQIKTTAVELTGNVGDALREALVGAFQAGDDKLQAMRKTIGQIIADVTSKLLFSKLLGPSLDKLTQDMTDSLTKGDGSIVDDLARFGTYGMPAVDDYFKAMEAVEEWAKQQGYDNIFGRDKAAGAQGALEGRVAGASEETVSVLIGQFNAVRIYQAQLVNLTQLSLGHLQVIAQNTSYNKQLLFLPDVVDRLDALNATSIRGFGL